MGEVCASPLKRFHGFERGRPVARDSQLIAVDMDGMWQLQAIGRHGHFAQDSAWRQAIERDFVIQSAVTITAGLPHLHATRVDQFDSVAPCGFQQP